MLLRSGIIRRPLVVLEGCGYHVNDYLWPAFEDHVHKDRIVLCVTDMGPTPPAQRIRAYLNNGGENVQYVDKSSTTGRDTLALLRPSCVYVATPDHTHCEVVKDWLVPVARTPLVIVEKPFAPSAAHVKSLTKDLKRVHGLEALSLVRAIDNYYIRALGARKHMANVVAMLGSVAAVEARVTESRLVETDRDLPGMILDLLPHALSALHSCGQIAEPRKEKWALSGTWWGRYPGACNLRGEETAGEARGRLHVHAAGDATCSLTIRVGKGIGFRDQKHIDLVATTDDRVARLSFLKDESALSVGYCSKEGYNGEVEIAPLVHDAHRHFVDILVEWLHGGRSRDRVDELLFDVGEAHTTVAQTDQVYASLRRLGPPEEYAFGTEPWPSQSSRRVTR